MFQLYFAGSLNTKTEPYLRSLGTNRLASQLLDRNVIDGWIKGRDSGVSEGFLFIDSGAYTAHTQGTELDVDKYCEYVDSIDENVHIFAQVDKIPGVFRQPKTRDQLIEAPRISWENYLYMRKKVKSPDKLVPIFHQGEDFKWLVNMLEAKFFQKHIPYIGISPANDQPVGSKEVFINKCFHLIKKSSNPNVCTHAFGMTSLDILENYPFTSADSTSWIMNAANGSIMTDFGSIAVSDNIKDYPNHYSHMNKNAQKKLSEYVDSFGMSLDEMKTDYVPRMIFNIRYLKNWSDNYVCKYHFSHHKKLI